jgi:uncharacterized Zn finger protein (UPF0148 family)
MGNNQFELMTWVLGYGITALILGVMAANKNRNPWVWGLIGGLFCLPSFIALLLLPYLCPKCERPLTDSEGMAKTCPTCGATPEGPLREEQGYEFLAKATKLEVRGEVAAALAAYQQLAERYPDTSFGRDAQNSLESLRAKTGQERAE